MILSPIDRVRIEALLEGDAFLPVRISVLCRPRLWNWGCGVSDDLVQADELWPVIVYFVAILATVGAMLAIPYFAAQRRLDRGGADPFESGIVPMGDTHLRLAVHFYPVAIFFVIFDLEAIFIFAWAVSFRESGWLGYSEMLIFVGVLLAALVYLWRVGALDWRTARQQLQDAQRKDLRSERCAGP